MITILLMMAMGSTIAGENSPLFRNGEASTTAFNGRAGGEGGQRESEPPAQPIFSFIDHFAEAQRANSPATHLAPITCGKVRKPAILQHPGAPGAPLASLLYRAVKLPRPLKGRRLLLSFSIGFMDGVGGIRGFNGCEFIVRIGNTEVFRQVHDQEHWQPCRVDIGEFGGRSVDILFLMDPRRDSSADSAAWGQPRILLEGQEGPSETAPIPCFWPLADQWKQPEPSRVLLAQAEAHHTVIVATLDEQLDLVARLRRTAPSAGTALVPLAPSLVVGEGEAPGNHTVVKILNEYGIGEVQFLAYPPEVTGGVHVCAGISSTGKVVIATAPITSPECREIRLFNRWGGSLGSFAPGSGLSAPFVLAVGDFLPGNPGNEVAICARSPEPGSARMELHDLAGRFLAANNLPAGIVGRVDLSVKHTPGREDRILILCQGHNNPAFLVSSATGKAEKLGEFPRATGLFQTAFGDSALLAPIADERFSVLERAETGSEHLTRETIDVGREENRFWMAWPDEWRQDPAFPSGQLKDGKYVRFCKYGHYRTDAGAPAYTNPDFTTPNAALWTEAALVKPFRELLNRDLREQPVQLWEPCFTHRQFTGLFSRWADQKDPATGFPRYLSLTRDNRPVHYSEMGQVDAFVVSTYGFGPSTLEKLYVLPLRAFLRNLAPRFREAPDRFPSLEPDHEHEIAIESNMTIGDYNPAMVRGFLEYLTNLYGRDLAELNRHMGTPFTEYFDAPRWQGRGAWDDYDEGNPFFAAWGNYNRNVVNRRLAQMYTEALLAGFPPEIIKSHQIPDLYGIGDIAQFSQVPTRITPIDYAMAAGIGFGFTRYTCWYKREHDATGDAHASGHDSMVLGEYQSLTANKEDAFNQLRFLFDHGVQAIHVGHWPPGFDNGYNTSMYEAVRRLLEQDQPRPGMTGGVGQIRAYQRDGRRYDIAVVGTGPDHTGLIKSLRRDGGWEGTVYVVPFHAHVEIVPVLAVASRTLKSGEALTAGPLDRCDAGNQVELVFEARTTSRNKSQQSHSTAPGGSIGIDVCNGKIPLPGLRSSMPVDPDWRSCRFLLRTPLPVDGIVVRVSVPDQSLPVEIRNLNVLRHEETYARVHRGTLTGKRHQGGVSFDIVPGEADVPGVRARPPGGPGSAP